ncbi:TetR family transcriptional regulator [[Mycobacterium] crassicus]|uniref:TetR family transcriptional regulator n=1 Tax=[Mycobacterium] crassicus TaxID=2872309 RepID=A0ABU5XCZ2_9MYCO|nr:TetR family transcriptional regulator [Mycolicibacter sp. MYC098]MEB3020149.1 TetR family transcriptional regulator [Mycolicibacter sp. MYC098]
MNSRTPNSRSGRSRPPRPPRPERPARPPRPERPERASREERKEATRRAIIGAALTLLDERSFSALSLREVTRAASIVPAAFYRHFESMDALGLVLIDESFRALRETLRDARTGGLDPSRVIESSVEILVDSVAARPEYWRFINRERFSGMTVLRYAIRTEIRLITSELATDLARFPKLSSWSTEDLNILAGLFVNAMIVTAEAIEEAPDADTLAEIKHVAVKQLRMIAVSAGSWRSKP